MQVRISGPLDGERLLPESWEDAGALAWPCLRALVREGEHQGRLEAIRLLCGFSRRQMRGLTDEQVATLAEGLSWLRLSPVVAPLRPGFRRLASRYELPAAKFENGTALEFALADDFFQAYQEGDEQALYHLLATLAAPVRNGKRQSVSDRGEALRRGRRLRSIPFEWLAAVWMYWAGVKQYVHDTYGPWLFQQDPPPEDEEDDTSAGPATDTSGPNFGWWGKYLEVAEAGVFGSLPAVHQTNFHELCMYLVKKEADNRAQQRALEAVRTKTKR